MEPIYPDILDTFLGKNMDCDHFPPVLKNNIITEFPGVCDTADRHGNIYYAPPDAGLRIASQPRNTYIMINVHLINYGNKTGHLTPALRIWHTGKLRKNDLDYFFSGSTNNLGSLGGVGILIPPRVPTFTIRSLFDTNCLRDVIILLLFY